MMKLLRLSLLSLALVLSGAAFGQSNLPACKGSDTSRWSNCFGSFAASNGDKYIGEYEDGDFGGQGDVTFASGDTYVGEFKNGEFNGHGIYTYANGNKYVGEQRGGKRNGQGIFTLVNGIKYVGEYKDNNRAGKGITYSANGSIEESGVYKEGVLVTSQYVDPNWFTRIAKNNTEPALKANDFDDGVAAYNKQDYTKALKKFKTAAAQGAASAQFNLGVMYSNGQGVIQDYAKAHMWSNLSAVKGLEEAVKLRELVSKQMTSQQIAEAQKLAIECLARNFKNCD